MEKSVEASKAKAKADYDLVLVALKGGAKAQEAYAKLMSRYRDSIYFTVLKMVHNKDDADDLTIEAFGKAFSKLEKYSPDYAFSTWLFKIAINNCIDFIRKKRIKTLSIDESIDGEEGGADYTYNLKAATLDPEEQFVKMQRKELVSGVMDKLNPKYKKLIELRFFKELSYEEISAELKVPLGTVKAQLYRAKELLFNVLKNTTKTH